MDHDQLSTERADRGFTLIELMVVVLVIAILLAIAIPTFLGARSRAQDRAAQSNLRNAYTALMVVASDRGDFSAVSTATLGAAEGSLTFQAGNVDSGSEAQVSVAVATPSASVNTAGLAARSDSGACFGIAATSTGGVSYNRPATCNGSTALTAPGGANW